jgi:hypothetical protein
MALIAPAFIQLHPSYVVPELLLPYAQASGAFETIASGEPLQRLSDGDLVVYIKRIDLRTQMSAGQAAANQLPSVQIAMSQIQSPSYLQRVRAEYDHHDTSAASGWGVSIVEANRLGMRQGHFQLARLALLQGYNPANGEGLLNTPGATSIPLPPDPNGNDTVVTYDNGAMAFFLLSQISAMKTRTNQLGIGRKFTVLGPQRDLGVMEYQNIVQLTQFQREGAGSTTTAGLFKAVAEDFNDDEITWVYDDTLIGQGAGGTDAILIVMPEVEKPTNNRINTNEFAKLSPGLEACTLQFCDLAAPKEIPVPIPGGAIDIVSEWRITPGWGVRPEAVTIVSMQYQ